MAHEAEEWLLDIYHLEVLGVRGEIKIYLLLIKEHLALLMTSFTRPLFSFYRPLIPSSKSSSVDSVIVDICFCKVESDFRDFRLTEQCGHTFGNVMPNVGIFSNVFLEFFLCQFFSFLTFAFLSRYVTL